MVRSLLFWFAFLSLPRVAMGVDGNWSCFAASNERKCHEEFSFIRQFQETCQMMDRADSPWWQLAYDRMFGTFDDVRTICPAPKVVYPLTTGYDSDSGCSDMGDQCGWNIFYCPLCGDAVDTRPAAKSDSDGGGGGSSGGGRGVWYLPTRSVIEEPRPRVVPKPDPLVKESESPPPLPPPVTRLEFGPGTGPGVPARSGRIMSGISRIVKHFHRVLAQLSEERFVWLFLSLVLHAMVYTTALVVYSTVYRRNRSQTNLPNHVTAMVSEFRSTSDVTSNDDDHDDDGHGTCDINACLQHANDLEEMAKAVEYLHKVNEMNERDIHNKAESISLLERTIHELYRQYQNLQKTMKEHGVKHNVEQTPITAPHLLMTSSKPDTGTSNVTPAVEVETTKDVKDADDEKALDKAAKKSKSGRRSSTEKKAEKMKSKKQLQ